MHSSKSIFLTLVLVTLAAQPLAAQSCDTPVVDERDSVLRPNAAYSFYLDQTLAPCAGMFQQVLSLWQGSSANAGFGARFGITTDMNRSQIQVWHQPPPSNPAAAGDWDPTPSTEPEWPGFEAGIVSIHPSGSGGVNCDAAARTFSHEVGHMFGLGDCAYTAPCPNSVMDAAQGYDDVSGSLAPGSCDLAQVGLWNERLEEEGSARCSLSCRSGQRLDTATCRCVPASCTKICNDPGWELDGDMCECVRHEDNMGLDPTILDTKGDGVTLTSAADGVLFDINADGTRDRVAWTEAGSDDGWLALDVNGNGVIDDGSELFGDITPQPKSPTPNGYHALAVHDAIAGGGNGNGRIDAGDAVFGSLRVWRDRNHNGISEPGELTPLAALEIEALELSYRTSGRKDRHGNLFRYRAKVFDAKGGDAGRWSYDVFVTIER